MEGIVTGLIVLVAAAALVRRYWPRKRALDGGAGCGTGCSSGCGGCPVASGSATTSRR